MSHDRFENPAGNSFTFLFCSHHLDTWIISTLGSLFDPVKLEFSRTSETSWKLRLLRVYCLWINVMFQGVLGISYFFSSNRVYFRGTRGLVQMATILTPCVGTPNLLLNKDIIKLARDLSVLSVKFKGWRCEMFPTVLAPGRCKQFCHMSYQLTSHSLCSLLCTFISQGFATLVKGKNPPDEEEFFLGQRMLHEGAGKEVNRK